MKKRILALLLAGAMALSLAACGGGGGSSSGGGASSGGTSSSGGAASSGGSSSSSTSSSGSSTSSGGGASVDDVWPDGTTVTVHIHSAAGGGTDLYTRYLTQALSEVCPNVNFVPQNYDTGEVAMETVKNADPDGKNLFVYHGGGIIQYLTGSSNVSMKDDMSVVGIVSLGGPQAIIAKPDAPYKNFTELADYVKAHPGEVVIGCSLGGTTQMIFVSLINAMTGDSTMASYVQCANEADKLTQTASGSIDIANCSIPNALNYEADGRLTILGTIGPDVSNLESISELVGSDLSDAYKSGPEQGFDSAVWNSNYYLMGPPNMPEEIRTAINEKVQEAAVKDSYVEGNKQMASFTDAVDLAGSQKLFDDEWAFMDSLVTEMGLKVRER